MTDDSDRIQALRNNYERLEGDRRWVIVTELERIAKRQPDQLLPHLDWLLKEYATSDDWTRRKLDSVFQPLVRKRPEVARRFVTDVSDRVPELTETNRETLYSAIELLIDEQPKYLWEACSPVHIEPLLEEDMDSRKRGFTILSYIGGPESVDLLTSHVEIEIGDMSEAAEEALRRVVSQACDRLRAGDSTPGASETLQKLADHDPEPIADEIELLFEQLTGEQETAQNAASAILAVCRSESFETGLDPWKLLDRLDSTPGVPVARVAGGAVAESSSEFENLVETLLKMADTAKTDQLYQHVIIALLEAVRTGEPETFPHLDQLLSLEDTTSTGYQAEYIELLSETASCINDAGRVVPSLVEALQSESEIIRQDAARGLANVGVYPAPDALKVSTDDPDERVRELVESVVDYSTSTDVVPLSFTGDSESRLLSLETELKYQTEPGRWDPLPIDEYTQTLLENIARSYQSGSSTQIQLPYYEPHASLIAAIELGLQEEKSGGSTRIALYTPGTQTQWGTFGDIRDAAAQFGLGDETISSNALPLKELFRIGRVQDGSVSFYDTLSETDNELILTKQLDEIKDIYAPDAVFCNLHSRATSPGDEIVETVRHSNPDIALFLQYSYFTKHEARGGWQEYGLPRTIPDGISPAISRFPARVLGSGTPAGTNDVTSDPISRATDQIDRLGSERSVVIHEFGEKNITDPLDSIYRDYSDLDEEGVDELAARVRSRLYDIRRLPVPVDTYNQWVRQEELSHGRYAPETTTQHIHAIEQKQDASDLAYVPDIVSSVVENLRQLHDALATSNPKFSFLMDQILSCRNTDTEIAVLFVRRQMQQAFEFGVRENSDLDPETFESEGIHLCSPDEFRDITEVDRLVLPGDVPKAMARFYLAPTADRIEILEYGESSGSRLTDWIEKEVSTLRSALAVSDGTAWPVQPAVVQESHRPPEAEAPEDEHSPIPEPDIPAKIDLGGSEAQNGNETNVAISTVRIETDESNRVQLDSNESVLLRDDRGAKTDLVWTTAGRLTPGDTFVIVPDSVRRELYEATLQELYEDEQSGLEYMDSLRLWWSTMRDIWGNYESIDSIYSLLNRNGLDKSKGAVLDWFRAVETAQKPLDLAVLPRFSLGS